jgi:galactoside 2-L-fucosyltransferase 1/2
MGKSVSSTLKTKTAYLQAFIILLVFMATALWTYSKPERLAYEHSVLAYEQSLCSMPMKYIELSSCHRVQCPEKPIVTVRQLGRLGNQMWEYISVWAVAKMTGHEPYVPGCLIQKLEKVFLNITIPPLSCIANCHLETYPLEGNMDNLTLMNGNILLKDYVQLPQYVVPLLNDVKQIFRFKEHIVKESQKLLQKASKGARNVVYVGVHVRRTDYKEYLKRKYNASLAESEFFVRQMNYFRNKYKSVLFLVMSDEPKWCEDKLAGDNVVVMKNNSPEVDLAIMAACNHSIIDYGTYGVWGAILAGGDTFVYDLKWGSAVQMTSLLPNWHIVTQ